MSHRLNPISHLKGCGINSAIAHQGSPFRASTPGLGISPTAGQEQLLHWHLTGTGQRQHHLLGQTQTLLLLSCFALQSF